MNDVLPVLSLLGGMCMGRVWAVWYLRRDNAKRAREPKHFLAMSGWQGRPARCCCGEEWPCLDSVPVDREKVCR
jgi:hypothetical protein